MLRVCSTLLTPAAALSTETVLSTLLGALAPGSTLTWTAISHVSNGASSSSNVHFASVVVCVQGGKSTVLSLSGNLRPHTGRLGAFSFLAFLSLQMTGLT